MTTAATTPTTNFRRDDDILGHPRGLAFLFGAEMWERFSYYGMRALLVLYMVKHLLQPENAQHVIGYGAMSSFLASVFGITDVQPIASQIYGFYTGLVYLTPIFGGLIADRWLGRRRTIVIGAVLMAIGHFMMAFESFFFIALLMLILGNGAFKPNMSSQVGMLYSPADQRRDRAYSIFYVGINIGGFFAPLVCGTLGETLGWHFGFGAAGVGMLIGLCIYLWGTRHLPVDNAPKRGAARLPVASLTTQDWRTIVSLLVLCVFVTFFWATFEQQGNTLVLWIDGSTDRSIDLLFWQGEIPTTTFLALNPFIVFTFTPIIIALWTWQAQRGREPSTIVKMALGCAFVAIANLIMVGAVWDAGTAGKASVIWLLAYFAIVTTGELYVSPIGLSLVSKIAPVSLLSMLMGVWLATSFTGNFVAGYLGTFWSVMEKDAFFMMIAGVAGVAGFAIWVVGRFLDLSGGDKEAA
ncbi:MAG: peptide MFS transporter [Parvibaculum sp.]|nr:peptide MFS transporter [Parvibaculum sp.]